MENTIYLGLSRQMVLQQNLNMVAQNIANMNTSGYRSQHMMFEEYLSDPRGGDDELSFVYDAKQYQSTRPGDVSYTGRQLDVALEGPGFINVSGPGGELMYTRAGSFQINTNGELTTPEGFLVGDTGGAAITIPQGTTDINIDDRGFVSGADGVLGQIGMTEFANIQELEAVGDNLYAAPNGGAEATETRMKQGMLEGSNVRPVLEMTQMIDLLRDFQSMQNVLQGENERLKTAIQRLTRPA